MNELACALMRAVGERQGRPLAALSKQLDVAMSQLLREVDALGPDGLGWLVLESYGAESELSLQRRVSLTSAGEAALATLFPAADVVTSPVRGERYSAEACEAVDERLVAEVPVGILVDGKSFAVMMATPADLDDFATGLLFAEGIIDAAGDILAIETHAQPYGMNLYVDAGAQAGARIGERARLMAGPAGCGLCGARNLATALRPPRRVRQVPVDLPAVQAARAGLGAHQPLNAATGCAHAALLFDEGGTLLAAREDVGRHNALDKAIGACLRAGRSPALALLTSRASVELVQKCVSADIAALATLSAPTATAVSLARACGMQLWAFVREGRATRYA